MARAKKTAGQTAKKAATKAVSTIKKAVAKKPKSKVTILRTQSIGDIRTECIKYADREQSEYMATGDAEAGKNGQNGFKNAINAVKVQLMYMKVTGRAKVIKFMEE